MASLAATRQFTFRGTTKWWMRCMLSTNIFAVLIRYTHSAFGAHLISHGYAMTASPQGEAYRFSQNLLNA